jgi:hypothetical protein
MDGSGLGGEAKCCSHQESNIDFSVCSRLLCRLRYFGNFMLPISDTILQGTQVLSWKFGVLIAISAIGLAIWLQLKHVMIQSCLHV